MSDTLSWRSLSRRLPGGLQRFERDRAGATAVEFGLIAMPFLAMLFAIFEIGYVDLQSELLAGAVAKASRAMLIGQAQNAAVTTAPQFVSKYLCPTTGTRIIPTSFDCSKLIVDVRTATSFVAGNMSKDIYKSASNQFCPGAPGQIVVMRVAYPLPAIFPLNLFNPATGVVTDVPGLAGRYHIIMGEALFQEETYANPYTPPTGC